MRPFLFFDEWPMLGLVLAPMLALMSGSALTPFIVTLMMALSIPKLPARSSQVGLGQAIIGIFSIFQGVSVNISLSSI